MYTQNNILYLRGKAMSAFPCCSGTNAASAGPASTAAVNSLRDLSRLSIRPISLAVLIYLWRASIAPIGALPRITRA
jgi:hypothetical protein